MAAEKIEKRNLSNSIFKLVLLVLIMLAFITMLIHMFSHRYGQAAERNFNESVKSSNAAIDKALGESLYTGRAAVRTAAAILSGLCDEDFDTDHSAVLQGIIDGTAAYGMYLSDHEGNILSGAGVQLADTSGEWNEEVMKGNEVMDVYSIKLARSHGELFVIACPVYRNNEVFGTVTAFFPMTIFTDAAMTNRIEWNSGHLLVSKDGAVLGESGFDFFDPGEGLFESSSFRFDGGMTPEAFLGEMERGKTGNTFCSIDGEKYFARYTPIIEGRWYLLTLIKNSRREQQINSAVSVFSQFGISFLIGFVVFVFCAALVLYSELRSDDRSRSRLKNDAEKDLLTGVYNKLSTEKYIREYMEHDGRPGMFYIIDIDDFKHINDSYGHAFGDDVLKAVGKRLNTEFRATDIIGRLGGDEFCVFLKNLSSDEEKQKQIERMSTVFEYLSAGEHVKYNPTASIGGAEYPKYGSTFEEIYKAADSALYDVKKNGKNGLKIYEREDLT
ncbi:MAG: sensor domain-containing diguanylate cyclase [Lachnospiraceae bacterium]|nr:sensor domain-containing diguanylate cyclase [Lachnospiraceae bacterium]